MSGYLNNNNFLDFTYFIAPPPTADSILFAFDKSKFEEGRSLIGTDAWNKVLNNVMSVSVQTYSLFDEIININISETNTPVTYHILNKLKFDYKLVNDKAKNIYKRASGGQFFNIALDGFQGIDKNNTSYPSGHANYITMYGLFFSSIFPDKTNDIFHITYNALNAIILSGLHWYTDVEAGKYLGGILYNYLRTLPEFIDDLKKAQNELTAIQKK